MQSLKSTAFAVTLLVISFGLYCVSSNKNDRPDLVDVDPILIEDSGEAIGSNSITLPSYNLENSATPASTDLKKDTPSIPAKLPELSTLQSPNAKPPQNQFVSHSNGFKSAQPIEAAPPRLPTLSDSLGVNANTGPSNPPLQLPEIATRQPESVNATERDNGLIDALKSNDFKAQSGNDNSFKASPPPTNSQTSSNSDNSYTSLAGAISSEGANTNVRNANGFASAQPSLSMPGNSASFKSNNPPKSLWDRVDMFVEQDKFRRALGELSQHYADQDLTGPQRQKIQGWLDPLARKVIYSAEHHFAGQPYRVNAGETLASICSNLKVPTELIYNINREQFGNSNEVAPGMELKVVNGPFHAEINLKSKMMTLFIKNLYAGRFPIAVGVSGAPKPGNFKVMVKSPGGYKWTDSSGKEYPAGSPGNAYGPFWIGLTGSLCIHSVPAGTPHGHQGCIGLRDTDARDVFGILSKDSQITIVQ